MSTDPVPPRAGALRLGVPLLSNDQIFKDVLGLVLESATRT